MSKQFFISQGSAGIYFDHPYGQMFIPMISTTQEVLEEIWDSHCREITTDGKKKIIFQQIGTLTLGVMSDDVENSSLLRRLLTLFYDLMQFRIELNVNMSIYNRSVNQNEIYKILSPLSKTMSKLSQTHQSMLVQGVERLQMNDLVSKEIRSILEGSTRKCTYLQHAVLLVGTQVVEIYSRGKAWPLNSRDLLMLIIFANSFEEAPETSEKLSTTPVKVEDESSSEDLLSSSTEGSKSGSKQYIQPKYEKMFFQTKSNGLMTKCGVLTEHFKSGLTLMLICDDQQDQYELLNSSHKINEMMRSFSSFLVVKAQEAHITMLHFLQYCPGLIHFIFIDRVNNKVTAPRITDLSDISDGKSLISFSLENIKKKVWDMVQTCMEYKDQGYSEVGIVGTKTQYWYKEWFEDETGTEKVGLTKSQIKNHYELYTMYLPFVSTESVGKYNKLLVQIILDPNFSK